MGTRYEWADDRQLIMNLYMEFPWTWNEYNAMVEVVMPLLRELQHPCATVVDVTKMGVLPKDGNILQIFLRGEKMMAENVFAVVMVGAPYGVMMFLNILMKLRPRAKRVTFFAKTHEEAQQVIHARHRQLYPESV